ncbi:HAD-IIIC family phosphatase [Streptomyces sp. NPDC048664]|uniref:HAD-IIIC family phosphatase n=1 Tax=Streptomyces sp. NPDC048664 TaxID=3154505 RepID=UPI0034467E96
MKTVKCLVWDLDNTLWQGTVLEDGQVTLDPRVRDVIAALDERGILQSIASKNDHDLAWKRLEEFGITEYFVLPEIGWHPKSHSIRRIADKLNFADAVMAFVDDQPAERAEVTHHLPEVRCYDAARVLELLDLPEFNPATVTDESKQRRLIYQSGFARESAREDFQGPDEDFLRTLALELVVRHASATDLARVEELTLRTSQMNATGVHYSDETLRGLLADPGHDVLVAGMADRFGSHGSIGIVLLERHPSVWHLKLLATSCRVVSFGAGSVLLRWLMSQAALAGAHLAGDFRRTERNRMMEVAYRFAGLTPQDCACLGELSIERGMPELQVLHVEPEVSEPPTTMRLVVPELQGAR